MSLRHHEPRPVRRRHVFRGQTRCTNNAIKNLDARERRTKMPGFRQIRKFDNTLSQGSQIGAARRRESFGWRASGRMYH